ncbi:unnamed protein product [Ectocarpus fasciculatus]
MGLTAIPRVELMSSLPRRRGVRRVRRCFRQATLAPAQSSAATPFGGLGKPLSPAAEPFAPVVASPPGGAMLLAPLAREPLAGLPAAERER